MIRDSTACGVWSRGTPFAWRALTESNFVVQVQEQTSAHDVSFCLQLATVALQIIQPPDYAWTMMRFSNGLLLNKGGLYRKDWSCANRSCHLDQRH